MKTESDQTYTVSAKLKKVLYLSFHKLLNIKGNAVCLVIVEAKHRFTFDARVPVIFYRIISPARGIKNIHLSLGVISRSTG